MLSSFNSPASICELRSSREILNLLDSISFALLSSTNVLAKSFASEAVSVETKTSPAFGTPLRPKISTGVEGPAVLILFPLSSVMALTLPWLAPAAICAPTFKVQDLYLCQVLLQ